MILYIIGVFLFIPIYINLFDRLAPSNEITGFHIAISIIFAIIWPVSIFAMSIAFILLLLEKHWYRITNWKVIKWPYDVLNTIAKFRFRKG